MRFKKMWLSTLFVWFALLPFNTLAIPDNDVEHYLLKYGGRADAEDELVDRVYKVFDKVSLVADKSHYRSPELVIVKGFNKPSDPLAVALPDGYIVLSKRTLEVIYKKVSRVHGDTRAAFVLGHELVHLANDHFLCHELGRRCQKTKETELEADVRGFISAAMAGYPVDKLIAEEPHQSNFFEYWEQQAFRSVVDTHPEPKVRAGILRKRLKKLLENLPYFHFGVRLAHFDRCDDAVYFFREFKRYFPSRDVYNNLGLCNLQKARKRLGKEAYSYWLPTVLDVTTKLDEFSFKGGGMDASAKEFFIKAKKSFIAASEMEPSYLPAKVNLAIAALYLGEIYEARGSIEKAYKLAPDDLDIQGLRAVILYEEGEQPHYVDMWPRAIGLLENLAQQPNVPLSVLYNIAQLLEKRGRTGADELWQRLAQRVAELPKPIGEIVCKKTACPQLQQHSTVPKRWDLPVKLGVKTRRYKTLFSQWHKIPSDRRHRLYKIGEKIYQLLDGTAEVLALESRVEMVVLKKLENVSKDDLPAYCGLPLGQRAVVNGTLWSCDNWAALVVDDKVKEVWVVKTQE
jgi:tetratricopeptide (TPR) repeat protein